MKFASGGVCVLAHSPDLTRSRSRHAAAQGHFHQGDKLYMYSEVPMKGPLMIVVGALDQVLR